MSVKGAWDNIIRFKNWLKDLTAEYGLETLLFAIALGNADVLHHYLLQTGSADTWQLTVAIYATELLVVWASLWRTVGLFISLVLFFVSMVSIWSIFPGNEIGHSGFSLAIFCGSLGNYVRRGGWRELGTAIRFVVTRGGDLFKHAPKVIPVIINLAGLDVMAIKNQLQTSFKHANIIKQLVDAGVTITNDIIENTKC